MNNLFVVQAILLGATIIFARQSSPKAHKGHSSTQKISHIHVIGACQFYSNTVKGQRYDTGMYMFDPTKDIPVHWGFGIGCHIGATKDDINDQIGAKFVEGKWIDENSKFPFDPDQHLEIYNFSGKNWTGRGIAYSQIYGDEDRRQRFFNFCLIQNNGPQVLCGQTQVRNLNSPPSSSTLPKIIAALKTIEFVDQSVKPTSGTAASH
ncbi:hypothetical protein [Dyella acidiphila]|uniref:Uncharacterized protein n=1 Tax=Dyella acidiphila TaxID=2775866 RepID=A0ABR9GD03_9GAMM|nr:hypothetical protein [Dyella acidiphila]MBE1161900.1 hypothetical protein [Dyella acidiphila]